MANALSNHCTATRPERPKGAKDEVKQARRARRAASQKSGPGRPLDFQFLDILFYISFQNHHHRRLSIVTNARGKSPVKFLRGNISIKDSPTVPRESKLSQRGIQGAAIGCPQKTFFLNFVSVVEPLVQTSSQSP